MFKKTAQYYNSNGLWLYLEPNESTPLSWGTIQDMPESAYNRRFNQIKWKNSLYEHLYAVSGKRDIRAIILQDTDRKMLDYTLKTLGLDKEYQWVIRYKRYYAIVIRVSEEIPMINNFKDNVNLLWEGGLIELPKKYKKYPKFKFGKPTLKPSYISLEKIANVLPKIRQTVTEEKEKADRAKLEGIIFIGILFAIICVSMTFYKIITGDMSGIGILLFFDMIIGIILMNTL